MHSRVAFTLIEILIVIALIVLLAGALIPAVGSLIAKGDYTKDANNMRQVGSAILIWRSNIRREGQDVFPDRIMNLLDESRGGPLSNPELFVSVMDNQEGNDSSLNFDTHNPDMPEIHEPGCSYAYELSITECTWASSVYNANNGAEAQLAALKVKHSNSKSHGGTTITWQETKRAQQKYGNLGRSFSKDTMPILRNFYHYDWVGGQEDQTIKKVLNVAWSTRVFDSIPYWEHQANPAIPLP